MMFVEPAIHKITHDDYRKAMLVVSSSIHEAIPERVMDAFPEKDIVDLIIDLVLKGSGDFLHDIMVQSGERDMAVLRKELDNWTDGLVEGVEDFWEDERMSEKQMRQNDEWRAELEQYEQDLRASGFDTTFDSRK